MDNIYTNLTQCLKEPHVNNYNSTLNCFIDHGFLEVTNSTIQEVLRRKLASQTELEQPFVLPVSVQISWSIFFGLMVLSAILGNCGVIFIVVKHKEMRSITNLFLINLSIADLLMAIFNTLFNFVYMLTTNWYFGAIYCRINNFIATVSVAASVFTITALCFDRFVIN